MCSLINSQLSIYPESKPERIRTRKHLLLLCDQWLIWDKWGSKARRFYLKALSSLSLPSFYLLPAIFFEDGGISGTSDSVGDSSLPKQGPATWRHYSNPMYFSQQVRDCFRLCFFTLSVSLSLSFSLDVSEIRSSAIIFWRFLLFRIPKNFEIIRL